MDLRDVRCGRKNYPGRHLKKVIEHALVLALERLRPPGQLAAV